MTSFNISSYSNAITELTLPSLITVGSSFTVEYTSIDALDLSSLVSVGNNFSIKYNDYLASLSAPNFFSCDGGFYINLNLPLPNSHATSLRDQLLAGGGIGGSISISGNNG